MNVYLVKVAHTVGDTYLQYVSFGKLKTCLQASSSFVYLLNCTSFQYFFLSDLDDFFLLCINFTEPITEPMTPRRTETPLMAEN